MSTSYELGRMFYYGEHSDSMAVCRLADEKLIDNMVKALDNQYVSAALTKEAKEVILSVISTHISLKSRVLSARQKDLKDGTHNISSNIELASMFYYHENNTDTALSRLADEELIGNLINLLNNHDMMVMLSKSDLDNTINAVAFHVNAKAQIVRVRQEELIKTNSRKNYSI